MSEPKVTPGPWTAYGCQDGAYVIVPSDDLDEGVVICSRTVWSNRADESHANARLISAAPDLYAACEAMLRHIDDVDDDDDLMACRARIAAALAKARGEAS